MIVFRTDASAAIGEGHIMRCITIAKELQRRGEDTALVTADKYPSELLKKEGFYHIVLDTGYAQMDDEIEKLTGILKELNANCILVDTYYATPDYFKKLKGILKTAYMDDIGTGVYPADIVVNYNSYADSIPYESMYSGSGSKLLLGTKYVPLREEFRSLHLKSIPEKIKDIMITTGSTDPCGISGALLNHLLGDRFFKGVRIHIAAGRYYTNISKMEYIYRSDPRVIFHKNIESMSGLMSSSDAVVSAGGTTAYELCACGTPSVIYSFADNQTRIREYLGKCGAVIDCGEYRNRGEECLYEITEALKSLNNMDKRKKLRTSAMKITDGRGAERLADCLAGKEYDLHEELKTQNKNIIT